MKLHTPKCSTTHTRVNAGDEENAIDVADDATTTTVTTAADATVRSGT